MGKVIDKELESSLQKEILIELMMKEALFDPIWLDTDRPAPAHTTYMCPIHTRLNPNSPAYRNNSKNHVGMVPAGQIWFEVRRIRRIFIFGKDFKTALNFNGI